MKVHHLLPPYNADLTSKTLVSSPPWKPVTLRAPALVSFAGLSLTFVIILELLSYKARRDGSISFADRNGPFTGTTSLHTRIFRLSSPFLTACYGLGWIWTQKDWDHTFKCRNQRGICKRLSTNALSFRICRFCSPPGLEETVKFNAYLDVGISLIVTSDTGLLSARVQPYLHSPRRNCFRPHRRYLFPARIATHLHTWHNYHTHPPHIDVTRHVHADNLRGFGGDVFGESFGTGVGDGEGR